MIMKETEDRAMQRIFKYTINPNKLFYNMPEGAKILTAHEQNGDICVWAEVDSEQLKMEQREILVFGTGHSIPDEPRRYIGTAFLENGGLVFHVYEGTFGA
jgi:hypothetical protein